MFVILQKCPKDHNLHTLDKTIYTTVRKKKDGND